MSKPRVFIASSTEALPVANAIHKNLEHVAHPEVWPHNSFKIGGYPLDSLLSKADEVDYAIFVFSPDDIVQVRGRTKSAPRDNVIFELGLFIGRLGQSRACIVKPRGQELAIPSDLAGLIAADYDPTHPSLVASLGPASTRIAEAIGGLSRGTRAVRRSGTFEDFQPDFDRLFPVAQSLLVFFIHSRRWREMNDANIRAFLAREKVKLVAVLPNLNNSDLLKLLAQRFEDGRFIPSFIADAYRYFGGLAAEFPGRVKIFDCDHYPTYSCYRFDVGTVFAAYPSFPKRQSVPTFEGPTSGPMGLFVDRDLELVIRGKRPMSKSQIDRIVAGQTSGTGK